MADPEELACKIVAAWVGNPKGAGALLKSDSFSEVGRKIGQLYSEALKAVREGTVKPAGGVVAR